MFHGLWRVSVAKCFCWAREKLHEDKRRASEERTDFPAPSLISLSIREDLWIDPRPVDFGFA
jgi:hypothetical protein